MYQEIIDEIECSLALLKPSALWVKPTNLSFKNGRFSGIWAKYQSVDVFIPHNELKPSYHLCSTAEDLIKSGTLVKVYPLRIDIDKQSRDPEKWQVPVGTMFSPEDRATAVREAEETYIKQGTVIEEEDFELEVVGVEYYNNGDEKRPKSVILRITTSSKYPILRPEQEQTDFETWKNLPEHSDRKSSKSIKRFFYKKRGLNALKIGKIKITLLPIFSGPEAKKLWQQGYVGKLKAQREIKEAV